VSGSSLYNIKIGIKPVEKNKWTKLCRECAGSIGSLVELLGGKLSERVMGVMTRPESGLFPSPGEIDLDCSCPDWADMCKHVASVLYGVGARLDQSPELLFLLRHVDHNELVSEAVSVSALTVGAGKAGTATLAAEDVGAVFGIEMAAETPGTAGVSAGVVAKVDRKKSAATATRLKKLPGKRKSAGAKKKAVRAVAGQKALIVNRGGTKRNR
jgi:uncharacterized Zn finger protein